MKTLLFMAISADGFVATETGSEEFLSDRNWETFSDLVREHGNFVVGRKTYDAVGAWEEEYGFDDFNKAIRVVVSSDPAFSPKEGYARVPSPKEALEILRKQNITTVLLAGGPTLNAAFIKEGLLDEIVMNREPVIIGRGLSLFMGKDLNVRLSLIEAREVGEGIVQASYRVES